jgi:TRAP-type C4-dicarboxylate transport system permease small subunit
VVVIRSAVGGAVQVVKIVAAGCFAAMILLTLVQVINRYALGLAMFWTEELIVLLLVWSMLLGLPVQLWRHEEIVVDVMPTPDPRAQAVKDGANLACSVAFCAILAWAGYNFMLRGLNVTSPALGLSRLWFFLPIPLSAALSVIVLLVRPKGQSVGGFD